MLTTEEAIEEAEIDNADKGPNDAADVYVWTFRALIADWRAKKAEIERLRRDIGETTLHWADRVEDESEAMRARCEAIARDQCSRSHTMLRNSHAFYDNGAANASQHIADAIAALKQS